MIRTDSDELGLQRTLVKYAAVKYDFTNRLVVGEAQGGHVLVLEGKLLEVLDDLGQLGEDEIQTTLQEDQVGIVGDCGVSELW